MLILNVHDTMVCYFKSCYCYKFASSLSHISLLLSFNHFLNKVVLMNRLYNFNVLSFSPPMYTRQNWLSRVLTPPGISRNSFSLNGFVRLYLI